MTGLRVTVRVDVDHQAIAALNQPGGIVGRATVRAGQTTADRVRALIRRYELIDTGAMLGDVTAVLTEADPAGTTVGVGTPNVGYTRYQRRPFLTEALDQLTPNDFA